MVALSRPEMTRIAARCNSDPALSIALEVRAWLISTCCAQRLTSAGEAGVEIPSSVKPRLTSLVARASACSTCTRYFSATWRETRAVTLGLPSRSEPIQLPGRKNGGQTGGTQPAFSPSTQLSKRRYTEGTISKRVVSKMLRTVSASSKGVGFL